MCGFQHVLVWLYGWWCFQQNVGQIIVHYRTPIHNTGHQTQKKTPFFPSKYRNAEQDDLWSHLTSAAHDDESLPEDMSVKEIMDTWTLQMGYPVVHVERDYEKGWPKSRR